jgi:hypothetical protein
MTMTDSVPMTRARWAILAVGVPVVLAILTVCTGAWVHGATLSLVEQHEVGYPVAFTAPLAGGAARVSSSGGTMAVRLGSGRRIGVRGYVAGPFGRPRFSRQDTAAGLSFGSQCSSPVGNCSSSYTVTVPARVPVNVGDTFGNLDSSGLHGNVTLTDGSGNLNASGLSGGVDLDDSYGTLSASGLAGRLRLNDNSGNVDATELTGNTQIQDSYGNVTVSGISAGDVRCGNQSGNVTISFTTVPRLVVVNDSYGNITLELPPGNADYRVTTSNSFGNTAVRVPQSPSAANVIKANDNSGNITIVRNY